MKTVTLLGITIYTAISVTPSSAKIRPTSFFKLKNIEPTVVKDITGEATLTLQQTLPLTAETFSISFQDGKLTENIEFYQSPRCYLHFRQPNPLYQALSAGQILKVSKIDKIYMNGSVHVTFWFDHHSSISDLACITNYNHSITQEELKNTLGSTFSLSFTNSIETENFSSQNTSHQSTRVILNDS